MNFNRILFLITSLFFSVGLLADNNGYNSHGKFEKWNVFSKKNNELCYMLAEPDKSIGEYTLRGRVRVLVARRPNEKSKNYIGVDFGYSFSKNEKALIEIDKKKSFKLDTFHQTAWTKPSKSSKHDDKIINEMIKGTILKATGKSKRGTITNDFYSLKGFSKAFHKMKDVCG
jgi:hypothetical protein